MSYKYLEGGCNGEGVGLLGGKRQDAKKWSQVVSRQVQVGHEEELICGEGGQVLEWAAWGSSGDPILGSI